MSRHLSRTDDTLDPAIAAELDRLEAALAGTASADPALVALVADVRADARTPGLAFRADLDARVAAGFRGRSGPRAWLAAARAWAAAHRSAVVPALGVAATALIALVVAAGVLRDGGGGGTAGLSGRSVPAAGVAQESAGAGAGAPGATTEDGAAAPGATTEDRAGQAPVPGIAPVPPGPVPPGTPTVPGRVRKVERTTQLALRTTATGLQRVADGIVRVTQSAGGVVEQSNVDATDRGGTADFTLSIPTARADAAVARLSRLAHVSSLSQSTADITAGFVSVQERLSDARAERRALLRALDAARTPEGIARLRARIRINRAQIASLTGELNGLRRRADTTTVSVTLIATGAEREQDGGAGGGWSPGDAAGDALRVLEVAAGVLIIALAVAVPLGLLIVPALLGARVARRRHREGALDGA